MLFRSWVVCVCVCVCVCVRSYQESSSKVTADGVVGLTRAFLAAGAQCVLVSLWPVPVAASKVFVHAFYTALLNGTKASAALADAMKTVQSSKQFSHPSNWAGETGSDEDTGSDDDTELTICLGSTLAIKIGRAHV